jgi:hypothetical protein
VDAAVASAGSAANTAAKLPRLAVAESKEDDKVAADAVNSIVTTVAETRDIAVGPANSAHDEQKDEHREVVLEANAVDGTDMVTPVFESLLTDEMEMVEETIKEDQAISSSSSSIRSVVEEPADRLSEGKGGGEVVVSEEEVKKDLVKEGGGDNGPTTAAATAATAKEQRRQEKKKYSYSIPALCQGGRQLELFGSFNFGMLCFG